MGFFHWIEHRFGWNAGNVVSFTQQGKTMVGFQCSKCDAISGVHEISIPELDDIYAERDEARNQ